MKEEKRKGGGLGLGLAPHVNLSLSLVGRFALRDTLTCWI